MSANLLLHPGRMHTFTDDLESFLHILGWTTLRYIPGSDTYQAYHRGLDMEAFDQHYRPHGGNELGRLQKRLVLCGESYPSTTRAFEPRTPTPLFGLLRQLSSPFKSLYAMSPPTAEARKNVQSLTNISDESQLLLCATVIRYDNDIRSLQSSSWFADIMKMALDEEWPTNDKADENLSIDFSGVTRRQAHNRTKELQDTQKLVESSKGLSSSSKRVAGPIAEPSAKRRCSTPPASGTLS